MSTFMSDDQASLSGISAGALAMVAKNTREAGMENLRTQSLWSGGILITAAVLEIIGMAHHPSVHTQEITQAMEQIRHLGYLSAVVHGVLIACMLAIAYGLSEFALRRGLTRPLIRAGAIAYAVGVMLMVGAALVSGYLMAAVVAVTPHQTATDLAINTQLLLLCGLLNQTCANAATVAMSAGIACWSMDLLKERGALRALGGLGLIIAALPAAGLILGLFHLDVTGMSAVVLLQALWYCGVGVMQLRNG
jgi:hypothetical protein